VTDVLLHVTRTATGACTITISSAIIASGKLRLVVKDGGLSAGTNNITIATGGAETIDGDATFVIAQDKDAYCFYTDGSNVFVY